MKMSAQNPLSGVQAIQQAPGGIPPALAQYFQQLQEQQAQQQAPSMDQSQFADYIKQLQDKGASPEQVQGIVQQSQQNGGQPDTTQGGSGEDTIDGGSSGQMSPLSQQLNALASGKGDVNYDQISGAYPTPRPATPLTQSEFFQKNVAEMAARGGYGGLGDVINANALSGIQMKNQETSANAALNQRDLGAYNEAINAAKEGGKTQIADAKNETKLMQLKDKAESASVSLAQKIEYQKALIDIAQQKADQGGEKKDNKPLSADLQKQLGLGLDQFIGARDAKGNILDAEKDIDPTQKNKILARSAMYLQQNPNVGVQGALGHTINEELGGISNIQEATSPFIGKNTPRMFDPKVVAGLSGNAPQTAPNVSGASEENIPTGGSVNTPSGQRTIVKQYKSKSTGQTKTVYSDGTEEIN